MTPTGEILLTKEIRSQNTKDYIYQSRRALRIMANFSIKRKRNSDSLTSEFLSRYIKILIVLVWFDKELSNIQRSATCVNFYQNQWYEEYLCRLSAVYESIWAVSIKLDTHSRLWFFHFSGASIQLGEWFFFYLRTDPLFTSLIKISVSRWAIFHKKCKFCYAQKCVVYEFSAWYFHFRGLL